MPKGISPRSLEHRKNISIALSGRTLTAETRHKLSVIASSRHLSEEHKAKIGESVRGERHPNWKGGITEAISTLRKTLEYRKWRIAVLNRDGYRCRKCGSTKRRLDAHHAFPFTDYPERRFDVGNGITLCVRCHKKYGAMVCQIALGEVG